MKNNFRLIRDKEITSIKPGEKITIQRIESPEFLLRASREISTLYQEALSSKSHEKFADIIEMIKNAAEIAEVDWNKVNKTLFNKRWESGKYGSFIGLKSNQDSLKP